MKIEINSLLKERNGRIHVACGNNYFAEYVNIDLFDFDESDTSRDGSKYDFKLDLTNLNDVTDGSLSEIMFIHGFEHFYKWETIEVLEKWLVKLEEGGILHIEMPDFDRVKKMSFLPSMFYNKSKKRYKTSIIHDMFYGNQWSKLDYETHKYVWSKREFVNALKELGFQIQYQGNSTFFHVPFRDMLIIAKKEGESRIDFKNRKINGSFKKITRLRNIVRLLRGLRFIFNI